MADEAEKTQKAIDKAVKTARKEQMTAVTGAIKDAKTAAAELEDKGQKKAVSTALTDLMRAVKDAVAE
jgi:hypothetical protein